MDQSSSSIAVQEAGPFLSSWVDLDPYPTLYHLPVSGEICKFVPASFCSLSVRPLSIPFSFSHLPLAMPFLNPYCHSLRRVSPAESLPLRPFIRFTRGRRPLTVEAQQNLHGAMRTRRCFGSSSMRRPAIRERGDAAFNPSSLNPPLLKPPSLSPPLSQSLLFSILLFSILLFSILLSLYPSSSQSSSSQSSLSILPLSIPPLSIPLSLNPSSLKLPILTLTDSDPD